MTVPVFKEKNSRHFLQRCGIVGWLVYPCTLSDPRRGQSMRPRHRPRLPLSGRPGTSARLEEVTIPCEMLARSIVCYFRHLFADEKTRKWSPNATKKLVAIVYEPQNRTYLASTSVLGRKGHEIRRPFTQFPLEHGNQQWGSDRSARVPLRTSFGDGLAEVN